jgi:aminodeoxyfutalosine synthase
VLEERIYHMAGAQTPQALSEGQLHRLIRAAGRVPAERDSLYNVLRVHAAPAAA